MFGGKGGGGEGGRGGEEGVEGEERMRLKKESESLKDLTREVLRCALSFIAAYEVCCSSGGGGIVGVILFLFLWIITEKILGEKN